MGVAMGLWCIVSTLAMEILVFLPLYLLGIPTSWLALQLASVCYKPSRIDPNVYVMAFRSHFLDAWLGNWEDGLCPDWWAVRGGKPFTWFLRNPVTNMRFWPAVSTRPHPTKIRWIGTDHQPKDGEPGFYICWQGLYSGIRWQGAKGGIWFGWKVIPSDRFGVTDYRAWGIGIACKRLKFK